MTLLSRNLSSRRHLPAVSALLARPWLGVLMAGCALAPSAEAVKTRVGTPGQQQAAGSGAVETVYFPSGDGKTELVGYVFRPSGAGPYPAMVMLHGRAGPYSSNISAQCAWVRRGERSVCNAGSLTKRTKMWGEFWAERGILAMAVDSFGPRGKGHGFGRRTHDDPARESVNELTVRPLDAEGALDYLQARRGDVNARRIAIQGWSNGASTTLNVMYRQTERVVRSPGFGAALVFYPGCGPKALLDAKNYKAAAATTVFLAAEDEEVNPENCRKALTDAPAGSRGGKLHIVWYDGATHDFDDPGASRQSVAGNARAKADAMATAGKLATRMVAP